MVKVRDVQPIMEHLLDRAEKAEKELALYKKALELACEDIDVICQSYETAEECKNCPFHCIHADLVESYLMKAREE